MSLQEILVEQIQDLYDAEKQLTKALPRMARASKHPELKRAFEEHLRVTEGQVRRIERVFEELGEKAKSKPCAAMKGLVEEGREIISEDAGEGMIDAALIGAAQKIEHYEISGYGTARAIAKALGQKGAADLLNQTAQEEGETDKLLTRIAMDVYKQAGARGQMEEEGEGKATEGRSQSRRNGSSTRGGRTSTRGGSQARSRSASRTSQSRGSAAKAGGRGASAHPMTDHDEIRQWAEERGATPSCVRGTGGKGDTGMIRLDFPGYSGAQSLQKISWDDWFQKFDENKLALLVQDSTARGQKSNFNKIVSRETAQAAGSGKRSRR